MVALMPMAAPAAPATVAVSAGDCRQLMVPHEPADDVAYKPGVDVDGRAVAPADLGGGAPIPLPDEYVIPIEVDLDDRFGVPANENLFKGDTTIGTVTLRGNRVFFAGREIGDATRHAIAEACRERLDRDEDR